MVSVSQLGQVEFLRREVFFGQIWQQRFFQVEPTVRLEGPEVVPDHPISPSFVSGVGAKIFRKQNIFKRITSFFVEPFAVFADDLQINNFSCKSGQISHRLLRYLKRIAFAAFLLCWEETPEPPTWAEQNSSTGLFYLCTFRVQTNQINKRQ